MLKSSIAPADEPVPRAVVGAIALSTIKCRLCSGVTELTPANSFTICIWQLRSSRRPTYGGQALRLQKVTQDSFNSCAHWAACRRFRQAHIAAALEFYSFVALQVWIRAVLPLVYQLECLAPALAQNGPNPEYPWPHDAPIDCPVRHQFVLWEQLTNTGLGRQLTRAIRSAVNNFPAYG